MKGLHYSTPIEEIKEKLEKIGFEIVNVANMKHRLTKNPLSMFYINLIQNPNNKDIYKMDRYMKIALSIAVETF